MRRAIYLSVLATVAALSVSGCGGEVGDSGPISPFFGSWTGNWNAPSVPENGTSSFSISTGGSLSGSMTKSGGETGAVNGSISSAGVVSASIKYPGLSQGTLKGTLTPSGANTLTGTLTQRINSQDVAVSISISR